MTSYTDTRESAAEHPDHPRFLTRREVAALLRVSPASVSRLTRDGLLTPVRLPGLHRFDRAEVEALIAALRDAGPRRPAKARPRRPRLPRAPEPHDPPLLAARKAAHLRAVRERLDELAA